MPRASGTAVATKKTTSTAVVNYQDQMANDVANIQNQIGAPGGDMIQVTQDKKFKLPDGTQTPGPFDAIIIDFVSGNFFYEGAYDPNNIVPPACFSLSPQPSGMVPSDSSPLRQADKCDTCPMNQFGSDGNGKACKNSRMLALLPPDGDIDTPLAILKVSPTALKAYDSYVASVARATNRPPYGVITEITFDDSRSYPSLRFGNPRPVDNDVLGVVMARREEARKRLLTEPDVSQFEANKPPAKGKAAARRR